MYICRCKNLKIMKRKIKRKKKFKCVEFVTNSLRLYICSASIFSPFALFCSKELYLMFFASSIPISVFTYYYAKNTKEVCSKLLNLLYINTIFCLSLIYNFTFISYFSCVIAFLFAIKIIYRRCRYIQLQKKRERNVI